MKIKIALHWWILIGMVLGVALGLIIILLGGEKPAETFPLLTGSLDVLARLFIKLLKMVIVPLIVATMINGVLSLGSFRRLGRMGLRSMLYYAATTGLSVLTGLVLVNLIKPGVGADAGSGRLIEQFEEGTRTWSDLILSLIPQNPVESMAKMEVLPTIVFSLLFGVALLAIGDEGKPLHSIFNGMARAMMKMTDWVVSLAPIGVFALMANVIVDFGWESLKYLAVYMITVMVGLGIHFFISLPLVAYFLGRYSPLRLFKDTSAALLTAFSSASSSATLPLTMDCLQDNTGVSRRAASFVPPIGATVNMDGTALYEAVAVLFIAQAYGIELGIIQQVIIFLTATLAAIGAAAIPSAGLFTMAIVLKAVGLPLEGVALIIGVDRVLDMARTATNVWGDIVGTVVVARMEGETFGQEPRGE